MKMMTLTCEHGHTWERASQRGRPPRFCPEHAPEVAPSTPRATKATIVQSLDTAQVAAAVAASKLSEYVVRAFLAAGLTVPNRDRVDRVGYTVAERKALDALSTPEPDFDPMFLVAR